MAGAGVKALALALRQLSRVPARVSVPFAAFVRNDLRRTIAAGQDPYGVALPPLRATTVRRKGHSRILYRTGSLQGSIDAGPLAGAGVYITVGPAYAHFHITGTRRMVARPFFPRSGMPKAWNAALKRLVAEDLEKHVKG